MDGGGIFDMGSKVVVGVVSSRSAAVDFFSATYSTLLMNTVDLFLWNSLAFSVDRLPLMTLLWILNI